MKELVALSKNPVPGGAVVGTFKGYDGAPLRYALWSPTRSPKRGTVCLFGGRGEFIEKYFETIADLRRRGFGVATMDWRGQGGSFRPLPNRNKGHIRDFAEHDRDLLRFMRDIVLPDCLPPFIAVGHSMGGHLLIRNAAATGSWFERMVVLAPMIYFNNDRIKYPQWFARGVAETATLFGAGQFYVPGGSDVLEEIIKFDGNPLTSDRERWTRNKAVLEVAPELGVGSVTLGWLRAAYRSISQMARPSFPPEVKVPMLVFAAGNDRIVATRVVEDFAMHLKVGTHVLIPSARHEILQETDDIRQRFWAAFDAYTGADVGAV